MDDLGDSQIKRRDMYRKAFHYIAYQYLSVPETTPLRFGVRDAEC